MPCVLFLRDNVTGGYSGITNIIKTLTAPLGGYLHS